MGMRDLPIQFDSQHIIQYCREVGIARLSLFGSVLRDDFDSALSDVDVLVRFRKISPARYVESYFGLKALLEHTFKRAVDLVDEQAIHNPIFKAHIAKNTVLIYED